MKTKDVTYHNIIHTLNYSCVKPLRISGTSRQIERFIATGLITVMPTDNTMGYRKSCLFSMRKKHVKPTQRALKNTHT